MTTLPRISAFVSGLVLLSGLVAVSMPSAQAAQCDGSAGQAVDYSCDETGDSSDGSGTGTEGHVEPTCDLSQGTYSEFCEGTSACWGNNPAANDAESVAAELGEKPDDPDAHVAYKNCLRTDGSTYDEWYWATPDDGPTRSELAQRAYGQLRFPVFTPTFNPPTRTFVNLDTWWWADGANTADLVGSSALGVRAIASPDHLEVDPGDGSGAFNCAFNTVKSDACSYVYRRASTRGSAETPDGSKAYPARMRLVWDVRFELNGDPINVAGVPAVFSSPWNNVAVPVREIQTVVQPRR